LTHTLPPSLEEKLRISTAVDPHQKLKPVSYHKVKEICT